MRTTPNRFFLKATILTMVFAVGIAFAQNRPLFLPRSEAVIGTVEGVSGNLIYVKTGVQLVAISVDDHTEVWKGKIFRDLSTVETGDDINVRYRIDASGKRVAETVWLNIVKFFGVITKTGDNGFEVFTNPNADPQSGYKKEHNIVALDADTMFETSAREDLKQGRNVQVVGLDLKNGTIRATKVTVYEGNRPVRMGTGPVILPNGQIR